MATVFAVRAATGKRGSSRKGRDGGRKPSGFSASVISETPLVLKIEIPAAPVKGEANRVLLSGLEKLLGCSVELLSGKTSRKKTLAAACSAETLVQKVKMNQNQR